ncbi:MAG: uracil-DNA glycosylase family protein, partial [Anaerolineales bacterium]|nr:uracil-DNA glycosylase family protein [Anaerolineales bacterium]
MPARSFEELAQSVTACARCPRLIAHCRAAARTKKRMYREDDYWGKPVPGFGDQQARVLIVGLAPAVHGANRTGRMFTGDGRDGMGASDFLAAALQRAGWANLPVSRQSGDGFVLRGVFMTAIARCAPPGNKLLREEILNCARFLHAELDLLRNVRVVIAVGKLAFDQTMRILAERGAALPRAKPRFRHAAAINFGNEHPRL